MPPLHWRDTQTQHLTADGRWQPQSLNTHLQSWARAFGPRIALIEGEQQLSYRDFEHQVCCLAGGLADLGIHSGDRVLVQLPNGIDFARSLFALLRLGAWPILAMPAHREREVQALCELAEPSAYIVAERFLGFDYRPMAEQQMARCPSLHHLIIAGDAGSRGVPLASLQGAVREPVPVDPHSTALLLLSGGTTGTPKLIPRTHADYAYNAMASAQLCGFDQDAVYLAALPIAHNFPLACPGLIGALSCGGRVVFSRTAGADEAFDLISRHRVTHTALVPPLVKLWLQAREWDHSVLSSLRLLQVGGARLPSEVAAQVTPALGCALQQVFGMAEGLLCYTRLDDPQSVLLNTQGRPLCEADEVRLVDADGMPVANGDVGELIVRGPYTISGYYRANAHNRQVFDAEGFFHSGDLARWSPEGNLVIEGRIKEQINRAGEKIAAAEIEQLLREHPHVQDAAVIALADERLGERVCACVILQPPHALDLGAVHQHCQDLRLPRHKWPDQLETLHSWPLTSVGKLDKKQLQQRFQISAEPRQQYLECRLPISAAPQALAAALAGQYLPQDLTLYEHQGEWSLGIGSVAQVRLSGASVQMSVAGQHWRWSADDIALALEKATQALPFEQWRAYGTATFELARRFHQLHDLPGSRPLLQLDIPGVEIRVREGYALIRALQPNALDIAKNHVHTLDAECARDHQDASPRLARLDVAQHDAARYCDQVERAVTQIADGRYQKIILSRKVPLEGRVDLVASYRAGRRANTPARSFIHHQGHFSCVGFSPETVVEVSANGAVSTQPLAGTRALGRDAEEEARLRQSLYQDPKEIAEHAVSVKLAFEELQPICEPQGLGVSEFMGISRRGSVQHLSSRLRGRLKPGCNAWHAFTALFPAVTASGIPKREAIAAIAEHEGRSRDLYSGCVMIADSNGSLDAALVLRSVFQDQGQAWVQAGAGIVSLSQPERELEETREKLASIAPHVRLLAPQAVEAPLAAEVQP
ncbi:salicylate synthase [Pseudomonas corrugata]|uniref:salicylate--[aryl-carrier protein] ligase n=1 Tax=Pseudomonas corrugata TaxID=47879 RepID=A0A7Y5Z333_9PSED|nr:salicylate synthase [Pseudomonas corrugata]NUT85011.1 salicylate synthase [Pseudomonas corrugata]